MEEPAFGFLLLRQMLQEILFQVENIVRVRPMTMQSYVEGQDVMNGEERKGNNLKARDLLTASLCTHPLLDSMTTFEAFTCFVP